MSKTIPKEHVELSFKELRDASRHSLAASIAQMAPSSPLYANTSIQASVAALAKKDAALAQSNATVENDKKKLTADTAVETVARSAFDGELTNLVTLTETTATSPADVASMALKPQVRGPSQRGVVPPVPSGIDVKYPKKGHGTATGTVQAPKRADWHFAVEASPNPPTATSWSLLVGTGKTRTLTGPSGTQMWLRAARVRGQLQSDWCTPVLVTIP
jgi:hypothetical protein